MPEFSTATGRIFYEVMGPEQDASAPTEWITLLHNFMSAGQPAWGFVAEALAHRYRVLLPDLPGHGRSLGHPIGFRHTEMARQLAALMIALGAERGHLAGCSSGGMIAQLMAHHSLVRPATLTLVSSTYSVNPETTGVATSLDPKDFRASRNWLAATAQLHDPYRYDGYFQDTLLHGFQRLRPADAIDLPLSALQEWVLPVCLIHGENDEIFPVQIAASMAAALPDAELHIVPGQTHALIFRRARFVRDRLADFLDRHPQRTAQLTHLSRNSKPL